MFKELLLVAFVSFCIVDTVIRFLHSFFCFIVEKWRKRCEKNHVEEHENDGSF